VMEITVGIVGISIGVVFLRDFSRKKARSLNEPHF
jgi:hypothetical protein